MTLCWIIPLIVGVVCAILGYLLGRFWLTDTTDWKREYEETVAKLNECRRQKAAKIVLTQEKAVTVIEENAFSAERAEMILGKTVEENDLTIIEGIGTKIAELLNKNGITTWEELARLSISECKNILEKGGNNYAMHNPATWSEQAAFAAKSKWAELKRWQDELRGGI